MPNVFFKIYKSLFCVSQRKYWTWPILCTYLNKSQQYSKLLLDELLLELYYSSNNTRIENVSLQLRETWRFTIFNIALKEDRSKMANGGERSLH